MIGFRWPSGLNRKTKNLGQQANREGIFSIGERPWDRIESANVLQRLFSGCSGVSGQPVARSQHAESDHHHGKDEADQTNAPMQGHAPYADETDLADKQDDPKSEGRAVDVNEQVWKRSSEYSGEEVCPSKTYQDSKQRDYRHAREEQIVGTNFPALARRCCCHSASGALRSLTAQLPGL